MIHSTCFKRPVRWLVVLFLIMGAPFPGSPAWATTESTHESAENAPPSAAPDTRPYTVLITSAGHGLGYEFARQYAERGWIVIAAVRKPGAATELQAIAGYWDNVHIEKLDVTSERSVRALAARYRGTPIDVLINNAGIQGELHAQQYGSYDFKVYDAIIDANVQGPLRMIEAFMDNVATSRQKKLISLSSVDGPLFYRSSEAALHMAIRTLSREVRQDPGHEALVFGLIDPGVVADPMITARESAEYCIAVIEGYTPKTSGQFLDRKGAQLPW